MAPGQLGQRRNAHERDRNIAALIRNDVRVYLSDRRAMAVGILVPILIAAFFGYVFGGGGKQKDSGQIPIALVDEDHSAVSRAIIQDLRGESIVSVQVLQRSAAAAQVRSGKVDAAAIFPQGFAAKATRALFTGQDKSVIELLIDPSKNSSAQVIQGLLAQYSMQQISKEAFSGAWRAAIDG